MIVEHIESTTPEIERTVEDAVREIALLREYRTRLIADVVTGKLDVRSTAARLADEAPPEAAEDDADVIDDTEGADEEAAV